MVKVQTIIKLASHDSSVHDGLDLLYCLLTGELNQVSTCGEYIRPHLVHCVVLTADIEQGEQHEPVEHRCRARGRAGMVYHVPLLPEPEYQVMKVQLEARPP